MGLFFYTQKGSIISMVDLPTTEIIEPKYLHDFYIQKIKKYLLIAVNYIMLKSRKETLR